jgi:hypothetical protein
MYNIFMAKHRYRDFYKDRFDEAKKIAWECLDTCTADIIQRFFNLWMLIRKG